MAKFVNIEPLERNFKKRYLDYRNRSQRKMINGRFRVDDELTTAAMIMESCLDSLREAPAADVAPVRHGWFEDADDGDGVICSVCRTDFCTLFNDIDNFKYCPNCGAKMDLEDTNHAE